MSLSILIIALAVMPANAKIAAMHEAAIQQHFDTTDEGMHDCEVLHLLTGTAKDVCARILFRESSGGNPGCMRLCRGWTKNGRKWECSGGYWNTYSGWNLPRKVIKKQATEVSRWQLRHSPSWSWIRYYNKKNEGVDYSLMDMQDPTNALVVMTYATEYLQHRAATEGPRCVKKDENGKCVRRCKAIRGAEEMLWLQYWNGCKSYRKHVKAVLKFRKELKALAVL